MSEVDICAEIAALCSQQIGERDHHKTTDTLHRAHELISSLRVRAVEAEEELRVTARRLAKLEAK